MEFEYNGKVIEYEIDRGKRRNIYISIQDGKVFVKGPKRMTDEKAKEIIEDKKKWICKKLVESSKSDRQEKEEEFFQNILKRFLGMPWDILETKRCLIRETAVEDVDAFYELYEDEEITRYMEPLFEDRDEEIEYTKSYIKNVYEFYGFGMWTIVLKDNGEVIGRAGVSYREGFEHPELGFMIGTKYQRQGLAYEVCSAILEYMHENYEMEEILIFIEPQNTPSILLAKKLGASFYKEQCMGKCDAYIIRIPQ